MTDETEFLATASWGRSTWVNTLLFIGIVAAQSASLCLLGVWLLGHSAAVGVLCCIIGALAPFLGLTAGLFSPVAYLVNSSNITIQRLGPNFVIPLGDISDAHTIDRANVFHGASQVLTSGGAFGMVGSLKSPGMGRFRAYVTRKDRLVVIRRRNAHPVVLSPDQPEPFLDAVTQHLGNLRAQTAGNP